MIDICQHTPHSMHTLTALLRTVSICAYNHYIMTSTRTCICTSPSQRADKNMHQEQQKKQEKETKSRRRRKAWRRSVWTACGARVGLRRDRKPRTRTAPGRVGCFVPRRVDTHRARTGTQKPLSGLAGVADAVWPGLLDWAFFLNSKTGRQDVRQGKARQCEVR
jgi:hypothetical protein